MEGKDGMSELYRDWINEDYEYIDFIKSENKVFQRLREKHQDNWEIIELCREMIFDNNKLIRFLSERIIDGKGKIKEFSRI